MSERSWLTWAFDVGLLPNWHEVFILLGWALVGLVATVLYKKYIQEPPPKKEESQGSTGGQVAAAVPPEQERLVDRPVSRSLTDEIEAVPVLPVSFSPAATQPAVSSPVAEAPADAPPSIPTPAAETAGKKAGNASKDKSTKAAVKSGKPNHVPVLKKVLQNAGMFIGALSFSKKRRREAASLDGKATPNKSKTPRSVSPISDTQIIVKGGSLEEGHTEGGRVKRGFSKFSAKISPKLLSPRPKKGDSKFD